MIGRGGAGSLDLMGMSCVSDGINLYIFNGIHFDCVEFPALATEVI